MRRALEWLGIAAGGVLLAYMIRYVVANASGLPVDWSRFSLAKAVLSILLLGGGYTAFATAWARLAERAGLHGTWREHAGRWSVSLLGKYVPGKIWHAVGRVALYRDKGRSPPAIAAYLLEAATHLAVASTMAGLFLIDAPQPVPRWMPASIIIAGVVLVLVAVTGYLERVIVSVLARGRGVTWHRQLSLRLMASVLGWEVIGYLLLSAGYLAAVAALGLDAWSLALPLMGGLLLGGVAGLAAIFVPAGLGVREGTLAWVLLGSVAPPTAVMLSLISRVWLTAGEAIIVTLGTSVVSNHRRHAGSVRKPRPAAGGLEWYGNLADPKGRVRRANRIATALTSLGGVELFRTRLLDVGCSAGTMTNALAAQCRFVVGTDVDSVAIRYANTHRPEQQSAAFIVAAGEQLPFLDDAFDVVVCNHVYEHARDPYAMMDEIWRVLRPGGWCYFAGGHTLQLIEPHYRLPFLSWLPKRMADSYLRCSKRGERYEERFLMPWQVTRLFSRFGTRWLASTAMVQDPARYELTPEWWPRWWPLRIPPAIAAVVARVAPTYIWMLRK